MRCLLIALFTLAANVGSAHAWGDYGLPEISLIASSFLRTFALLNSQVPN